MKPIKVEVKAHLMVVVTVKIHMSIENALTYNKNILTLEFTGFTEAFI